MWTTAELALLSNNYSKCSKQELLALFPNKKYSTIVNKANKSKLYRDIEGTKILKLLDGSDVSWYWLGFILADGNLTNTQLRITLAEKDLAHLEKLADYLEYPKEKLILRKQTHGYAIGNLAYTLCLGDTVSIKQLKTVLCLSSTNKTRNPPQCDLSKLTDSQVIALFSGYFDGDGCKFGNRLQFSISLEWETFIISLITRVNSIILCDELPYIKKTTYLFIRLNADFTKKFIPYPFSIILPRLSRKYK